MPGNSGRKVTHRQLESLWEILVANKSLATGFNKDAQAREKSRNLWRNAEQTLNAHGDGAVKDWKGWSKYWSEYKSRIKARVASVRTSNSRTGGGPADVKPLLEIELKFLQILGQDFGAGLPGARVDPFYEEFQEASAKPLANHGEISVQEIPPTLRFVQGSEPLEVGEPAEQEELVDQSEPVEPATTPVTSPAAPSLAPSTASPATAPAARQSVLPSRSPRRVRRRAPVFTQEMARRELVEISRRREITDRENLEIMRGILEELKEIKSRLPAPPPPRAE